MHENESGKKLKSMRYKFKASLLETNDEKNSSFTWKSMFVEVSMFGYVNILEAYIDKNISF